MIELYLSLTATKNAGNSDAASLLCRILQRSKRLPSSIFTIELQIVNLEDIAFYFEIVIGYLHLDEPVSIGIRVILLNPYSMRIAMSCCNLLIR